ncbi:hypothetical protein CAPTEDRAFT_207942 [Capitella teleta]|uniref:Uncharacterized protein n=1 Tax=Capitella teleta TaxID=283909 RepID=R7VKH8_CAPTE|nr:hypothetical protein CAPTEDRAFT_207942 [Capitella teleta]|eukprot:ELU16775.1 hypothetical protein CAPTEDRAFT_207942 [Capitella teleta]
MTLPFLVAEDAVLSYQHTFLLYYIFIALIALFRVNHAPEWRCHISVSTQSKVKEFVSVGVQAVPHTQSSECQCPPIDGDIEEMEEEIEESEEDEGTRYEPDTDEEGEEEHTFYDSEEEMREEEVPLPVHKEKNYSTDKLMFVRVKFVAEHTSVTRRPAVNAEFLLQQNILFESARTAAKKLTVGGDGHSGALCQSNEVGGSYHMEKEGLIRCLDTVMGHDLQIGTIVTDRHLQIAKFIREELQGIIHRFGVWHVVKGFSKKWESTSKLKGCQDLSLWTKSVVNHMYWSAASSDSIAAEKAEMLILNKTLLKDASMLSGGCKWLPCTTTKMQTEANTKDGQPQFKSSFPKSRQGQATTFMIQNCFRLCGFYYDLINGPGQAFWFSPSLLP